MQSLTGCRCKVACRVPITPGQSYGAPGGSKALRKLLTPSGGAIQPDNVTSPDITKGSQGAHLHYDRPVRRAPHSHARLEEYVRSSLRSEFCFVRRIIRASKGLSKASLVVGCHKDHNGLGAGERRLEHVAYVGQ